MMATGLLAAFLIGSVPFSYMIVKFRTGKDIRTMGSGNAGATNVFRSVGKKEGALTLAADFAKGIAAVALVSGILQDHMAVTPNVKFTLGVAAICGHVFTPFLGFKGGKGVATGAGMALAIFPLNFALAFAMWLTLLLATQYMSVASMIGALTFSISLFFTLGNTGLTWAAIVAAFFIIWTHRLNISRLLRGEEGKTSLVSRQKSK